MVGAEGCGLAESSSEAFVTNNTHYLNISSSISSKIFKKLWQILSYASAATGKEQTEASHEAFQENRLLILIAFFLLNVTVISKIPRQ